MNLIEELLGLAAVLDAGRIEYAVCGGIAVAIHGHPRFTKDLDLLVQRADVEKLRGVARKRGFTLEGMPMLFGAGTKDEREILRLTKVEGPESLTLDLLLADRTRTEWRGRALWVVSRDGLLQMKRISGRAQDIADIQALDRGAAGDPHA